MLEELHNQQQEAAGSAPQSAWWHGIARANQLPPGGDWRIWLLLAGRGFGKTRSIIEWAIEQARTQKGSRGAFVGATASDVRDILVQGESGVLNVAHDLNRPTYNPSKRLLTFPNGSIVLLFSADEPNRLRGLQHHWAVCDELAAWRYPDAWDQLLLGLRLGADPRVAVATTPRPTKLVRSLLKDPTCVHSRGSTYDNETNLAKPFLDAIVRRYEGTTLGRQELYGELIDDNPAALWKRSVIDAGRVLKHPELRRVVVAIDPAATANADSDETGIVVAGVGDDGHGYILDDVTLSASPDGWARAAVTGYYKHEADRIVAETNNGGDMVEHTIRTVDRNVSFKQVRASRGKQTRAEPVAALYEQGRVHHVGTFAALEDQMCSWMPGSNESPDRMDALVWALTELMVNARERRSDTW
jgi:Uncharacterized conserved protein